LAHLGEPVGREGSGHPAPLPSGYLLAALVLLLVAPPALAGWVAGAWVVRVGWVSRGRLAAAGGVTGALAVLLIDLTRAAGGLLSAVATLGGVLPATPTAGTGVVLAGQSSVALGSEEEHARLLAAASCILLFRTPQPAELAGLAGTERVAEGAWQVDDQKLTGRQTVTCGRGLASTRTRCASSPLVRPT
jgi:hypothetical protein